MPAAIDLRVAARRSWNMPPAPPEPLLSNAVDPGRPGESQAAPVGGTPEGGAKTGGGRRATAFAATAGAFWCPAGGKNEADVEAVPQPAAAFGDPPACP